jgi:uncharacterized membrane protein YkoI
MKSLRMALVAVVAATALMGSGAYLAAYAAGSGAGDDDAALLATTKVPIGEAIRAAEQYAKGTAVLAELEDENGAIVWGVEVVGADQAIDVKVDSQTGKVLRAAADQRDHDKNAEADRHEGEHSGDSQKED